jgi:Brp/Blh family beta-carotene 15,15'-monooxygenase
LEIEIGKIPMTLALNPESKYHLRDQVVIPLGTRAGAVKSTTGYAFKFMAEHADNIVNALQSGTAIPTAYHHLRLSLYDKILLRVLAMDPSIGKSVFQRLFSKRKTSEVLKFLDEKTNIWEEFRILSVLPYRPFLQGLANIVSEKTALYKNRSAGRQNLAFPLYESVVMGIAFVAVFLNHFSPNLVALSTPWILLGGLIFPGIPHGAVDHWVALGKQLQWSNLFRFVFKYIVLMGGIAFIWWLTPAVGFLLFLIYSAWHFGETDLRDWNAYNPWQAILWGTSVLGTLLFGHLDSLEPFLSAYGIEYIYSSVLLMQKPLLLASLFGLSLSGWFQRKAALGAWARTSFILILGFALPLLLAFAFYFIGCHSARGWSHLQNELEVDNSRMLVMSLPFSLGAWAMAASLFFLLRTQDLEPENIWPLVFVFIAAISGPHVYIMHMMYRRRALK